MFAKHLEDIEESSEDESSESDADQPQFVATESLPRQPPRRKQSYLQFTAPPMPAESKPHNQMFVELYDLDWDPVTGQALWQETARWIKYEEDAEGIDHHWGRPHVAFLSFHALHQLKVCLKHGLILLDLNANNFEEACIQISTAMADKFRMDQTRTSAVLSTLQRKHRRVEDVRRSFPRIASIGRSLSSHAMDPSHNLSSPTLTPDAKKETGKRSFPRIPPLGRNLSSPAMEVPKEATEAKALPSLKRQRISSPHALSELKTVPEEETQTPRRKNTMHGSPSFVASKNHQTKMAAEEGAESAQVFVGTLAELKEARFCMVRLKEAVVMPELLEAVPIRFLFVILGPSIQDVNYHEIGRSIATLMSNQHFHSIAYSAPSASQIDSAIDDFLDGSIVIPPGEIDSKDLLSVDDIKRALKTRKGRSEETKHKLSRRKSLEGGKADEEGGESKASERGDPLKRTGRLFGGLRDDLVNRVPWYWSDFRDALNTQCVFAVLFTFFAAFAPAITFGGKMSEYTDDQMGIEETLLAQCLCGLLWGVFSAQPLTVVSITGPVLIFESSLYTFCQALGLRFFTIRVWTGFWVMLLAAITVAFEGSFLISYVTEFSEDIFSILISIIFIKETIKFLVKTFTKNPLRETGFYARKQIGCGLINNWNGSDKAYLSGCYSDDYTEYCCQKNQPDTALTTLMLLVATFLIAYALMRVRSSAYFGRTIRKGLGDFGVLIAILIVGFFDKLVFTSTYIERLHMPKNLNWTNATARDAGVLVPVGLGDDQWWGYLFAAVPALLVYILLFVETEVTQLLLAKKEKGLCKGTGYHWDLLLIGALCFLCGLLGLPWMCAAAVESLGHASALTVMKRAAPGERPKVDYVIEQRVTIICSSLLIGGCAFLGKFLRHIPMAAIYGIFLYLGLMCISSVPLIKRMMLLAVPEKYFPNTPATQNVSMWRMHAWTAIQLALLAAVYTVKHFQVTSLGFPFALMLVALFRMFAVPRLFSSAEIQALDGHEEAEDDSPEEAFPYSVF